MKFCKFVGSSYPHIFTNFYRFILIFHHMALIFPRVTHRFHPVKFWVSLFTQKMKMQLFENDVIFSSSRVSMSDNCKQSITVRFFTINVLLTLFWSLVGPTDGKIVLQRQTVHADAVADLPVPLFGLHRTAEPVWLTRLQTFWTVLNFHPLSGYTWKWWLSHQVLAHEASAFNTQNLTRWERLVLMEKLPLFDEILR